MWGNPVAEMMYETLRYFARQVDATPAFTATYGADNTDVETTLGLPRPSWQNPYADAADLRQAVPDRHGGYQQFLRFGPAARLAVHAGNRQRRR